jgi:hypothetical protein
MNRHLNKEGKEYKSHVKRRVLVGREGKWRGLRRVKWWSYFLYMYEYGTLKPIQVILRRGRKKRKKIEGMNQTGIYNTHIWKCYIDTHVQLLYTNKNVF